MNKWLVLAGFLIILILLLPINAFYWCDDFAFINEINKFGVIQNCVNGYLNWDGRFLTLGGFFQSFLLANFNPQFIVFIWSICCLTSGFLVFRIIKEELKYNEFDKKQEILFSSLTAIVLWFGSYKHFSETIYWSTGGIYSFFLLQCAIWILYFLKFQNKRFNHVSILLFLFFSFLTGATSINLSIPLLVLIVYTIIGNVLKKENKSIVINGLILAFMFFGFLFITMAPGNFVRFKTTNNASILTISTFFKNLSYVLFVYSKRVLPLMVLTFLVGSIFFKEGIGYSRLNLFKTKFQIFKWLIVAFSSILPFVFIPNLVSHRTSIFFNYFIFIFSLIFIFNVLNDKFNAKKDFKVVSLLSKYFVFFAFIIFVGYELYQGYGLKSEILKREFNLKSKDNTTVKIKLIKENLNSNCYKFTDFPQIETDDNIWIKESQEIYYGKKIIILK